MRQQLILNSEAFLISESASERIRLIIKEDMRQQEINFNFFNPGGENQPSVEQSMGRLPQEKPLLFSRNE